MTRTMLKACLASTILLAASAGASTERYTLAELRAYELELKQQASAPGVPNPRDTVTYTGTLVGGSEWNRPFADCTGQSALGPVRYHEQLFSVSQTGSYSFASTQTGFDGFIFIYSDPFNPTSPSTNCVAGNDDSGGIGTSSLTTNLTAGTLYVAVTTAFEIGEEGPFSNTLTGPGTILLGGGGPRADLGVTKTAPGGVANGGSYVYALGASNAGPDDATGVTVTDVLPAGVTFVSSTCGATVSGQTVTWSIGGLLNGGSASCDLTVDRASLTCSAVTNTATIAGAEPDPVGSNNTSTHSNGGGEQIVDGGFEAALAPAWAQTSSNFGSPLCSVASCGTGGGSAGPNAGSQWIWFGGAGADVETGSVSQSVAFPAGATSLTFQYRLGVCAGGAADFIRLTVGGTEVWRRDSTSGECAAAGYTQASIDVSAYAGTTATISFESTTGAGGTSSNFNLDDVSLAGSPTCSTGAVPITIIPTTGGTVTCSPNPVASGGDATCTATPDAGQTFTGWTAGCSGTNPVCTLTNVTAPVTVQAAFGAGPGGGPEAVALPVSSTWLMVLLSGLLGFVGLRTLRPATRR
ncbi:InlB B-repeat-containing protein [Dokdonella sp. MW10]|uniref:InlB B-repeat-containing protein n=1 Tax=Dokdonella sp. MW10 TaxID=2992926 RepID=UPI003F7EA699